VIAAIRVDGLAVRERAADRPQLVIDPVCGMAVVVGPDTEHLRLAGHDHFFCGAGCRAAFAATSAGG
jgi:xanthine dehydrogenase accessory factor